MTNERPVTEKQSKYIAFMCKVLECDNPNCTTLEEARNWISDNQNKYRKELDNINAWMDACYENEDWGCK